MDPLLRIILAHKAREPLRTATTKPQLATGPQKCVVFGPVGEFTKALSCGIKPPAFAAIMPQVSNHSPDLPNLSRLDGRLVYGRYVQSSVL